LKPNDGALLRHNKIGYCPQTVILNEALTVDQHLDFFCAAYNSNEPQYIDSLIEKLGYPQYRTERVSALSGGTRQKLNLTLALMHNPRLLLLDEPYQGFDWETYLSFWEIVTMLQKNDCAIIVISHLFFEQKRFDTLYRLQDGRLHLQEPESDKGNNS
jgi:ABC-type multidrug transport system ATPase subunit